MIVSILYYLLTGFIAALIIRNFVRSRDWQEEFLYVIVLLPFLLRILRLK